jgi:hypothetical protein
MQRSLFDESRMTTINRPMRKRSKTNRISFSNKLEDDINQRNGAELFDGIRTNHLRNERQDTKIEAGDVYPP